MRSLLQKEVSVCLWSDKTKIDDFKDTFYIYIGAIREQVFNKLESDGLLPKNAKIDVRQNLSQKGQCF